MGDVRFGDKHTRRTLLMMGAAALPAAAQTPGSTAAGERPPHPIVHFEIGCRDRAKSEKFFADLFGWQMQTAGPATNIATGGEHAIAGHMTALGHEPFHYTMFYVQVEDIKAYLAKAVSLGGKTIVPPIKIPIGTFAWFSDPDGNTIGLLQPA